MAATNIDASRIAIFRTLMKFLAFYVGFKLSNIFHSLSAVTR
jgi:hypothetical protein